MFGEIRDQLFQGNRGVPKKCGSRDCFDFENRLIFVSGLLATLCVSFYLHAQVSPLSKSKTIREPTHSAGEGITKWRQEIELKRKAAP